MKMWQRVATTLMLTAAMCGVTPAWAATPAFDNRVGNPRYNYACADSTQANPHHVCRTDNATLGWWMESSLDWTGSANDTAAETAINDTMSISYNGTDLNTSYDTTPVTSGTGETDIVYRSKPGDFTTGDTGYTWCNDAVGYNECDQQYVNFKYTTTTRPLACHETGHAVGLLHGPNASPSGITEDDEVMECMMKHTVWAHRGLGPDNAGNINRMY